MSVFLGCDDPRGIVLFAPGAGGDPSRYERLLAATNEAGFIVASPEHELAESYPDEVVRERAAALRAPLDSIAREDLPVVAAGHSLGGCAALCLAGGRPVNRQGHAFEVPREPRVERVVLLAPALDWFRGPDSLTEVTVPLVALVGSEDDVTPAGTADLLRAAPAPLDLRTYDGVGHFDFMSPLPAGKEPVVASHDAFYARFMADFVAALG